MHKFRLSHILLCGLLSFPLLLPMTAAQDQAAAMRTLPAPYQKWLDEDVRYLVNDAERAAFATLTTDQQRDKFVEQFWERRNPNPGSGKNIFKEEHYRRLAYVNQHFAESVPGFETDRGRIYILYGPPDEREQHPEVSGSAPSDAWRYHFIEGIGRDVVFEFVDSCRCGKFLLQNDPAQKRPQSQNGEV